MALNDSETSCSSTEVGGARCLACLATSLGWMRRKARMRMRFCTPGVSLQWFLSIWCAKPKVRQSCLKGTAFGLFMVIDFMSNHKLCVFLVFSKQVVSMFIPHFTLPADSIFKEHEGSARGPRELPESPIGLQSYLRFVSVLGVGASVQSYRT